MPKFVESVICPICNNPAPHRWEKKTYRTGKNKKVLVNECCGLRSFGRGVPLVTVDDLRGRRIAHEIFDKIWKEGHVHRSAAYRMLAGRLGHPSGVELHFKDMKRHESTFAAFVSHDLLMWARRANGVAR